MPGPFELALNALRFSSSELFQASCLSCGRVAAKAICPTCTVWPWAAHHPGASSQSALTYQEPWRTVLHAIKLQRFFAFLDLFRPVFEQEDFTFIPQSTRIVPVPIHFSTLWERGFNQSEWLADELGRVTGYAVERDLLGKLKKTPPQRRLGKDRRARNWKGVFGCRKKAAGSVVLVDDVQTSGETLRACEAALREGGAERVYSWTLFRA